MKLPEELRLDLEKELRYIADRIISEEDARRKIFFYSGAFNVTRRILGVYYDPQLVCVDMVLEVSCNTISERIDAIVNEKDESLPLIEGFFEKLAEAIRDLADCIKSNKDTYKALEGIASLALVTTPSGYYLYEKGLAKI